MLENAEIKKLTHTNTHSTHLNTVIFGQGDPGKTPYNSWGKPVRELLLISEYAFYNERKIQQKISKQTFTTYLVFCAPESTGKYLQMTKQDSNKCCTASSIFVPTFSLKCRCTTCLEMRAKLP